MSSILFNTASPSVLLFTGTRKEVREVTIFILYLSLSFEICAYSHQAVRINGRDSNPRITDLDKIRITFHFTLFYGLNLP